MVFVWSNLSRGEPHFTLSQVALNDTIMVFAFAPIVGLLLGLSAITVPWDTLVLSVALYIVVPVICAQLLRRSLLASDGQPTPDRFLTRMQPVSLAALLATLVLLFGFQGGTDHRPAARHRNAGFADPDPGLFQRWFCLSAQPAGWRTALRRRTFGADRRQQFLRARGCCSNQPLRLQFWCGARNRCRRVDRGSSDAFGRLDCQRVAHWYERPKAVVSQKDPSLQHGNQG